MKQKIEICVDGQTRESGILEINTDHPPLNGIKVEIFSTDTAADIVRKLNDEITRQPVLANVLEAVEVKNANTEN